MSDNPKNKIKNIIETIVKEEVTGHMRQGPKVFSLSKVVDFEGGVTVGIFTSLEVAKQAVSELTYKNDDVYVIFEHNMNEVDEDPGMVWKN